MHESLLIYKKFKYLKLTLTTVILCIVLYLYHSPIGSPNGGTWLGYTLGTLAALIMFWLAWFGARKRSYNKSKGNLEEWASAHVYLGLALVVISTLHSGFQFGLNIHTILYFLMMIVIISGIIGVYFYLKFPRLITKNRNGLTTEMMLTQITEIDEDIRELSMSLDDFTVDLMTKAIEETVIGKSFIIKLRGIDPDCPTSLARKHVREKKFSGNNKIREQLLSKLTRKEKILDQLRNDLKMRSLLQIWLYIHVPFTFAALAALVIHIFSVFYYW